jgi:hypothetical protein
MLHATQCVLCYLVLLGQSNKDEAAKTTLIIGKKERLDSFGCRKLL